MKISLAAIIENAVKINNAEESLKGFNSIDNVVEGFTPQQMLNMKNQIEATRDEGKKFFKDNNINEDCNIYEFLDDLEGDEPTDDEDED